MILGFSYCRRVSLCARMGGGPGAGAGRRGGVVECPEGGRVGSE